ncbi:MAG: cell division protein SepF [bacterium]|nr:cell division protein SepF [bacterium]
MGLFSKKKEEQPVDNTPAAKKMIMENIMDPNKAVAYADNLLKGIPLCLGFGELDIDEANKIIAFLSGVVYAIDGSAKQLNDNAFLFATKENYLDGSLNEFLKNFK